MLIPRRLNGEASEHSVVREPETGVMPWEVQGLTLADLSGEGVTRLLHLSLNMPTFMTTDPLVESSEPPLYNPVSMFTQNAELFLDGC